MRFNRFVIHRYRAIREANVTVGNNLIPLIGVNESGKTSILQAILAFDKNGDSFGGGEHLQYKNRYETENHPCQVSADVELGDDDFAALAGNLRIPEDSSLFQELKVCTGERRSIRLIRHLDQEGRPYSIEGLDHAHEKPRLAQAIYQRLPFVLYFDDFTDRVPDVIRFQRIDNERGYRLATGSIVPWQRVVEEVIIRATEERYTLSSFLQIEDDADRRGILSDITDVLEKEVIAAWRELKRRSPALADDAADLRLRLDFSPTPTSGAGFEFSFAVEDRSTSRSRYFKVSERSKGFQWYFNFLMKLRFNPKYQEDVTGAIYLLDEPGSYLHASAQEELLKALRVISDTNSILYCTHSQHLLNPEEVNVGQARIVSKESGVVSLTPFGSARTEKYQGALTPIYEALRLRTGIFGYRVKHALITEGITEYYVIKMLTQFVPRWSLGQVEVIPGAGADQLSPLISFAVAFSERFAVLLDSDRAGINAKRRYERFFEGGIEGALHLLRTDDCSEGVRLEDLFSEADQERLKEATGAQDTKAAFIRLQFEDDTSKTKFFGELDDETVRRLSWLKALVGELSGVESVQATALS